MSSDRTAAIDRLARALAVAWAGGPSVPLPSPEARPRDRAEAYLAQELLAALIGEPVVGWKAGASSPGMRARDGQDGLITGRVFASRLFSGDVLCLPAADFAAARAEPEFAFVLKSDLPPGPSRGAADLAPLVQVHIAVELVASRYAEPAPVGAEGGLLGLADNGSGLALVIGPEIVDPERVDFLHHHIAMSLNGGPEARQTPPYIRAAPYEALAEMVNHLGSRGIGLAAGMAMTVGATTEALPTSPGATLHADFGMLGAITIRFEV